MLAAVDGTDLGACRCQVQVRTGAELPLSGVGMQSLSILAIDAAGVSYGATVGTTTLGSGGPVGSTNTIQNVSVTVDAVAGDVAVLTLSPAEPSCSAGWNVRWPRVNCPPGTEPTALAGFAMTVLQGLSVQARDGATAPALDKVVDHAMRAWDHLIDDERAPNALARDRPDRQDPEPR